MAKDAKPKGDSDLDDFDPQVVVDDDVRQRWQRRREALKIKEGSRFAQRAFGKRIGVSGGTVSNVETGEQRTLPRSVYAKWQRELFGDSEVPVDLYGQAAKVFAGFAEQQLKNLLALSRVIRDADDAETKKIIAFYRMIKEPTGED